MGTKLTIDMSERGRNGGKARAASLSPAKRRKSAQEAAKARWDPARRNALPLSSPRKAKRKTRMGAQGETKR